MARTALIVGVVSAVLILTLIGAIMFDNLPEGNPAQPTPPASVNTLFFIRDPEFTTPFSQSPYWGIEAWNNNPDSISEIVGGTLHLFYDGTTQNTYGNSGAFQGRHTGGQSTEQSLLVGPSSQNTSSAEYVVLPKNFPIGKFWVKTRFKIDRMGYNSFPSAVNLGLTLMCATNNNTFALGPDVLWLDVYFAGYIPYRIGNETSIGTVPRDISYSDYRSDGIHAGYYASTVQPSDFGKWIEVTVDLGDYISKTLTSITRLNIDTIRVYGFILFVECVGAYAEVHYNLIETYAP